jgi:hypothetical protein
MAASIIYGNSGGDVRHCAMSRLKSGIH